MTVSTAPIYMNVDLNLRVLRTSLRKNSKIIIDKIINDYVQRVNGKAKTHFGPDICMFCASNLNLTREHVIPRWLFEGCPKKDFITNINGLRQNYNRTTITACSSCNNNILSQLEIYINTIFSIVDLNKSFFCISEVENIIRWLEIIEYKFQLLNIKRRFLTSKAGGFIPYLSDFPISMLRLDKDYTPAKVISEIRRSQKRIGIKDKTQHFNSLVVFRSRNKSFHFFHTMDDFIFLELPQHKKAFFYFFNKEFSSAKEAYMEAKKIIEKAY